MKYYVFSDVHGCYSALLESLNKTDFDINNLNHKLLFLGDAFDKNRSDKEFFDFIKCMLNKDKLIWVIGNHDYYLLNCLNKYRSSHFSATTIRNLANHFDTSSNDKSDDECIDILLKNKVDRFIKDNTVNYFETNNYVFVHGSIPYNKKTKSYINNWRELPFESWVTAMSDNGMRMVNRYNVRIPNKTLVCGHVGSYYGNIINMYPNIEIDGSEFKNIGNKIKKSAKNIPQNFDIYYGDGVIGIDGRVYDTNILNILIIED